MDVFKMLALGADTVLIGRPIAIAAVGADSAGVKFIIQKYNEELRQAMSITGSENLNSISLKMLFRKFDN